MEKINPISYFYYHLYLLQLEEYDYVCFLRTMGNTKGIPRVHLRKKLVWTSKMVLIAILALVLIGWAAYTFSLIFLFAFYISFVPIVIATIIVSPLDFLLKKFRIIRAKNKIFHFPQLKIIGIAGSYGKTTMKEVVSTILSQKYHVVKTPENINTPLGIAELILKKVNEKTEVLVVEMGEYTRGDIKDICSMVKPQIGILTGINEAHLERMGNISNTISALFELAQNMDENGLLVLNSDDKRISANYKKYIGNKQTFLYSSHTKISYKSALLGRYAQGVIQGAASIAQKLGLTEEQIKVGASLIKPLPHRLEPIEGARGVLVIDDSYNGNPEGVEEAIYLLSTYKNRRKIYITPGLVETGEKNEEVHRNIGKNLAPVANKVVLVKNSATPFIAEGLLEGGFNKANILWYASAREAHAALGEIIDPNDVVLFQNDWPDNYV